MPLSNGGYDLNIWAYARVDTVKDGMLEKLKRAGFNWLAFGIEAASDRVRDDVDKGFEQEEIFRTLEKVVQRHQRDRQLYFWSSRR